MENKKKIDKRRTKFSPEQRRVRDAEKQRKAYHKMKAERPWMLPYLRAKTRCKCVNDKRYHRYGGRGIKFLLEELDMRYLWYRDKPWLMDKASIDRIDNDGHYEVTNCRFIELRENVSRAQKGVRETYVRPRKN